MSTRVPLVVASGGVQQLQSGDVLAPASVGVLRSVDVSSTMPPNTSLVAVDSFTLSNNVSFTIPNGSALLIVGSSGTRIFSLSDAPNAGFDVANTNYVTFLSKTAPTLSVGDTLIVEVWASILNNSGIARVYNYQFNVGNVAVMDTASLSGIGPSSTDRGLIKLKFVVSISSTSLWYVYLNHDDVVSNNVIAANTFANVQAVSAWNTGSNDLTGSQTISIKAKSAASTATQTLTLHSYEVRRMPRQLT